MKRRTASRLVCNAVVLLVLIVFVMPTLYTIFTSFKSDAEIYRTPVTLVPAKISFSHYGYVFTRLSVYFLSFFRNSVVVTSISVLMILAMSSLAGYALARIRFWGKRFIVFFVSLVVSIPLIITVIPIFMMETTLGVKNTNLGLILPYTAVYLPIPLFIMYATFLKIPGELEESAKIDGCNRFMIYARVFLPLAASGLVSSAIITFLSCWGEFLFALILTTKPSNTTLPIGLLIIKYEEMSWQLGSLSTVIVLSIIIPMTLYFLLQRFFVRGLIEGSIKG